MTKISIPSDFAAKLKAVETRKRSSSQPDASSSSWQREIMHLTGSHDEDAYSGSFIYRMDNGTVIQINETFEHIGSRVWDTAVLMAKYFEYSHVGFSEKKVLELGSGTGLLGIATAYLGGNVTLTDQSSLLGSLTHSVSVNSIPSVNMAVDGLDWTDIDNITSFGEKYGKFDFIIGSDVAVLAEHCKPLINVLNCLCSPETQVIIGNVAGREGENPFLELMTSHFTLEFVQTSELHPSFKSDRIFIIRAMSKGQQQPL